MKRLLPFIPIVFLFMVNSCTGTISSNPVATAVAGTQMALTRTAAPTQTPNPHISNMVNWMNNDLAAINPLESTLDAEYHVVDLSFPYLPDSLDLRFRVDVSCMCMNSDDCCVPERTFVVIVESMKRYPGLPSLIPGEVREVMVVCSDHRTKAEIGAISATWDDVKGYLQGSVSGYQLGARATRTVAP